MSLASEELALRISRLDPVQRSESMKVALAEFAPMQEENRVLWKRIRCFELEAELGRQRIAEAQARECKRQRIAVKGDGTDSAFRKVCTARRNAVRDELWSADGSVSTSKLARLVRKSLSRQWELMSVEEQDGFFDRVASQRKVTNQ